MVEERKPQLVENQAPKFRVRSIPHGEPGGISDELESAEADGYDLEGPLAQANGDVVLIFRKRVAAAGSEEA